MIHQDNQLMTEEIQLIVCHVIRYCKLATNSCVYATFSSFLVTNLWFVVVIYLLLVVSYSIYKRLT